MSDTMPTPPVLLDGITVRGESPPAYADILTPEALSFVAELHRAFNGRRLALLDERAQRQARWDAGERPDFLPETRAIRESEWTVAPIPDDLQLRRVEITGPVDRKMIINALNAGADVFMADLEDSTSPTWANVIEGQINLRDATRGTITFTSEQGKHYRLNEKHAVLFVRPRGWHLDERHLLIEGEPASASIVDFGLYFFHNAQTLLDKGSGPYFYLPKLESYREAELWNDLFVAAQAALGIPNGSIRATVLIETIHAAFQMHEILWALRDHSAGLNCGRWDYIFSTIKSFSKRPEWTMPDRAQVTMTTPMMRAYSLLTIQTCHKRGIHAMGGMAAQIPIRNDPEANESALAKVRADKAREVADGHDGTWVAHPGLVPIAMEEFARMPIPNQIERKREDVQVSAADLLTVPQGSISEAGVRTNINVGIQYVEAWLRGLGCVPIHHLMEDAATAEISRAQLWQWLHHRVTLDDGRPLTPDLFDALLADEMQVVRAEVGDERFEGGRFPEARDLFHQMSHAPTFDPFLTTVAYELIAQVGDGQ